MIGNARLAVYAVESGKVASAESPLLFGAAGGAGAVGEHVEVLCHALPFAERTPEAGLKSIRVSILEGQVEGRWMTGLEHA